MCFKTLPDEDRPYSTEVFLDTSIHCCKLKGPLFVPRVDRVLAIFKWRATCTYTQVEYGNVVLSAAQYLLRKITDYGSLAKAKDFVGNRLPHGLHSGKVTWTFNLLREVYGNNDAECTERAIRKLRSLMRLGVKFVDILCDGPLEDGVACYWARHGFQRTVDGGFEWKPPRCTRSRVRCKVHHFFEQNRDAFRAIKDAIDNLPSEKRTDQLRGFSEVIHEALQDPEMLLDYKTGCKRLADAIIAVESVHYKSLFSQNIKESDLFTRLFEQAFYYLPPDEERGVQIRYPNDAGES